MHVVKMAQEQNTTTSKKEQGKLKKKSKVIFMLKKLTWFNTNLHGYPFQRSISLNFSNVSNC